MYDEGMTDKPASEQIDDIINQHGGWKSQTLKQIRDVIKKADPDVVEEVKWKMPSRPEGLPVWYHNGIMCLTETFKNDIKLVFTKGALLEGSTKLFNARLLSKTDRAVEFHDGDTVDKAALHELVVRAVKLNESK